MSIEQSPLLPPANEVCEGYVFTGVCHSVHGGGHVWLLGGACVVAPGGVWGWCGRHAWLLWGGMHGCSRGGRCGCSGGDMHGCSGGHVWLLGGACMVALGGHAWFSLGGHAWFSGGACMLFWGACVVFRWDTVSERAVRILLECILVLIYFTGWSLQLDITDCLLVLHLWPETNTWIYSSEVVWSCLRTAQQSSYLTGQ